jgi:UDP-N-acetylglucosamine 1-carboxyvinyltransferase
MGAKIEYFDPKIENPQDVYNFNYNPKSSYKQAIRITGPQKLHNAVLTVSDLRAGATLVMGALIADGQSILYGIEHLERGYEKILKRLQSVGAQIEEVEE